MPSRYVREGWIDSDRVRAVGDAAEVMLLRLVLVVDDYATFDGRLTVIQRRCWPAGDDEPGLPSPNLEEIENRLRALEAQSLIFRYKVGGKPYLFIPNFQQRTRAKKSKYPMPPESAGHVPDNVPADDGQMTGAWKTPAGRMPDTGPSHDGGPQAGSSSSSRLSTNSTVTRGESKPPPVDKSTRKVQGGLTTATPARPQPPAAKSTGAGLKPPAAMTPAERESAGIAPPPPGLLERFKKPERQAFVDELDTGEDPPAQPPPAPPPRPTQAPQVTTPADWDLTPDSIDEAGKALGMQRLPFEDDRDFASRIEARIALG